MPISRRTFLTGTAAGLGLVMTGSAASRAQPSLGGSSLVATTAPSDFEFFTPRAASEVWGMVGAVTHLTDSPYKENIAGVIAAVQELNLTRLRNRIFRTPTDDPTQRAAMRQIHEATGATFLSNLGQPGKGPTAAEMVAWLETFDPGIVTLVESCNEPNHQLTGDWATKARNWTEQLDVALSSSSKAWVRALPLLSPALAEGKGYKELGRLDMCDYGNVHVYQAGGEADNRLHEALVNQQEITGGQPVIVSETGYHNALGQLAAKPVPTSEEAAASYIPKVVLENALRPEVAGVYFYELVNRTEDTTNSQHSYGLMHSTSPFTPKPAFTALKALSTRISDNGTGTPSLEPIQIEVTGPDGPDGLEWLLLARSDGRHQVVLWRRVPVWVPGSREPGKLPVPAQLASVRLNRRATQPNTYYAPGKPITVMVGDEVQVLTFKLLPPL